MQLAPLGDSAVVVSWPDLAADERRNVLASVTARFTQGRFPGVTAVVPAYASVTIFYDLLALHSENLSPYARLGAMIAEVVAEVEGNGQCDRGRVVELEVSYGGSDGPDLIAVATQVGLSAEEVIARHSAAEYRVEAIGFTPGFPYLSGLPRELATPRRATPRTKVPAGTVGIGGGQTGVYPLESPGGWQLIGRTNAVMFDAARPEPALLRVGDRVKFRAAAAINVPAVKSFGEVCHLLDDKLRRDAGAGLRVVSAGMLTTVQDLGRPGQRAVGVPSGGAADTMAARIANLLVGNPEDAAGLELTLLGPEIEFLSDGLIALGGADFAGCVAWQPVRVVAGQRIKFGAAVRGCRGFLAVAGGVDVPVVLGSRSTYTRAGIGGWRGRALQAGDELPVSTQPREVAEHWWLDRRILPAYETVPKVRVVLGAQADEFGEEWYNSEWKVTPQSDRMGLRLEGTALARRSGGELVSTAVAPGTVQVPPDGQPIVLLADAQTIGGYPQLAHVISVDLPLLAQVRPGDGVRFEPVSLENAHRLWLAREYAIGLLREGLVGKIR